MSELDAITAPTHDAPAMPIHDDPPEVEISSDAATLPLHGSITSETGTRLHRTTLIHQVHNPNAE